MRSYFREGDGDENAAKTTKANTDNFDSLHDVRDRAIVRV